MFHKQTNNCVWFGNFSRFQNFKWVGPQSLDRGHVPPHVPPRSYATAFRGGVQKSKITWTS